jgi:hypothetical protein
MQRKRDKNHVLLHESSTNLKVSPTGFPFVDRTAWQSPMLNTVKLLPFTNAPRAVDPAYILLARQLSYDGAAFRNPNIKTAHLQVLTKKALSILIQQSVIAASRLDENSGCLNMARCNSFSKNVDAWSPQ